MTPQQEALHNQICELPVIKKLEENDSILFNELELLKEGQDGISDRLDKGAEKMNALETGLHSLEGEMRDLKDAMTNGLKEVITEIKDTKISDLKNELKGRKSSDNALRNDVIKILIISVIGALGYLFIKSYG